MTIREFSWLQITVVTKLWYDNFSKYRLAYTGETGNMSINTTLSENGENVIVKIVNPTENPYDLTIEGDWKQLTGAGYQFIAPGSLKAANSMESPNAVSVEKKEITPANNAVNLTVTPFSAGVLTLTTAAAFLDQHVRVMAGHGLALLLVVLAGNHVVVLNDCHVASDRRRDRKDLLLEGGRALRSVATPLLERRPVAWHRCARFPVPQVWMGQCVDPAHVLCGIHLPLLLFDLPDLLLLGTPGLRRGFTRERTECDRNGNDGNHSTKHGSSPVLFYW